MNNTSTLRFQIACALAAAAPLAALAAPGVDVRKAYDDFMRAGRNNKTPIADVSNAFTRVLSATNVTAEVHARSLIEFAKFHGQRKLFEPSLACYEAAAALEKAPASLRARALSEEGRALSRKNFEGAFATYYHKELDRAAAVYLRLADAPYATPMEKAAALKGAATAMLDAKQDIVPEAEALLVKATKLPGLKNDDRIRVELDLVDYYLTSLQYDKARQVLGRLSPSRTDEKVHVHVRYAITERIVNLSLKRDGFDKTLYLITKGALKDAYDLGDVARFCGRHGRGDLEYQCACLGKPGADVPLNKRVSYMMGLYWNAASAQGFEPFRAFFEKDVVPLTKEDPALWKRVMSALNHWGFRKSTAAQSPLFADWFFSIAGKVPEEMRLSDSDLFKVAFELGSRRHCESFARKVVAAKKPGADRAALALAVLGPASDKGAAVLDCLKKNPPKDEKARSEAILDAARFAMRLRDEKAARSIYKAYEKILVQNEPAELGCPFIQDAPQNIAQIVASDFYKKGKKGTLNRKYGEHLQFLLETDAAITGRKILKSGLDAGFPEIYTFCDNRGLKIVIDAPASKEDLKRFKEGFGGLAGYEAYFAAGIDSPYDFLMLNPGSCYEDSGFNTQYDNSTGYRNLSSKNGSLEVTYLVDDDSVTTMVSLSWAPYFSKLPENGTVWYFEPIIWMRGGLSWGGSESVHNRSSFGRIVFENLTPANRTAIKRGLLAKAVDSYRRAKSSRNGQIEIWMDPELGDQDFYAACVKPLCDRLDPYEKLVKAEMTDAQVNEVFDNAAVTWFNIDYVISQLRRDYLDAKRVRGE